LNIRIKELETINETTLKQAERYLEEVYTHFQHSLSLISSKFQRDYYKSYAEQLKVENSKKWRLQERDDWKALVDSVQRDRSRLQDECNTLEAELQTSQEEILSLKLLLAQRGMSDLHSSSTHTQSPPQTPLALDESIDNKAMNAELDHPPTASVNDSSVESSLDEDLSSEQPDSADQDQAAETPPTLLPQGIGHTESPTTDEAQRQQQQREGQVDGSTPVDENYSREEPKPLSPSGVRSVDMVARGSPPPPPVVLTPPRSFENLPPVPPSPLPRSLLSPGSPRSPKKLVPSTPIISQVGTPLVSRPHPFRSSSVSSLAEGHELTSSHTPAPHPPSNQLMKELTHELMQTKEEVCPSAPPLLFSHLTLAQLEVCQKSSEAIRRSQEEEINGLREDMEVLLTLRAQCNTCIRKNIYLLHHNTGIKSTTDPHMYSLISTAHPPTTATATTGGSTASSTALSATQSSQTIGASTPSSSTPLSSSASLWPNFNLFSYFFSPSSAPPLSSSSIPTNATDIIQRV
jgi:hypothetical protein